MEILENVLIIIILIIGIALSISLHELGHMIPAKKFNVPVTQYMVGFGPTIYSKKIGETEYGIKAILLGGYTKILGMFPKPKKLKNEHKKGFFAEVVRETRNASVEELTEETEPRAFYHLSSPKKIIVMISGTLINLVLGCIFLAVAISLVGVVTSSTSIAKVSPCVVSGTTTCSTDNPVSPAAKAGLKAGDKIIAIDGESVSTWQEVTSKFSSSKGETLSVTVERDGKKVIATVEPVSVDSNMNVVDSSTYGSKGFVGVTSQYERTPASIGQIASEIGSQIQGTITGLLSLPVQAAKAVSSWFTGGDRGSLVSLIGVGQVAVSYVSAETDFSYQLATMLSLLGSLNIALFVLNLLPLVPFDGGHVVNAIYEGCVRTYKRKKGEKAEPSDLARSMPIAYFVIGIFIIATVILMITDIINPIV